MNESDRQIEVAPAQSHEISAQPQSANTSLLADAYDFVERHPVASAATVGIVGIGAYAASRYIPYALGQRALAAAAKALNPQEVRIVPLTAENLPGAIAAGKDGFRYGMGFLNPASDFAASLNPLAKKAMGGGMPHTELNARYFVAVDKENRVLGTTGLYQTSKDQAEAVWLGWMSVRPAYRGKGIGQKLLDFSIDEAKKDNVDYLRLFTSTYRGERAAQPLYERAGLKIVGEEKHSLPIPGLKFLFREMPLKPVKAQSA
jgi:GNAT superfamily N-acetyltransferase